MVRALVVRPSGGSTGRFYGADRGYTACSVEYSYVVTDQQGGETIVASGEFKDGARPPDDGDSVTLEGPDGVARPWKIIRTVEIPYVGLVIHVEPLE